MKNCIIIPWSKLNALSYGAWDFIVVKITKWLQDVKRLGLRFIVLPKAQNYEEQYCQALAMKPLKRLAKKEKIVILRQRLIKY